MRCVFEGTGGGGGRVYWITVSLILREYAKQSALASTRTTNREREREKLTISFF